MADFLFWLFMVLFLIICLFMTLLVLIQKGRGGGLASAFGGAGGNTAFGSKTGDVLTWATSVVFGIFLLLAIALNLTANQINRRATAAITSQRPTAAAPAGAGLPTTPVPAQPTSAVPDGNLPPAGTVPETGAPTLPKTAPQSNAVETPQSAAPAPAPALPQSSPQPTTRPG